MNRKDMVWSVCDYVLSQDHEREDLIDEMVREVSEGATKEQIYSVRENSIYYRACVLAYGKREANKMYRECIKEAMK
jgi:hypothetical protein